MQKQLIFFHGGGGKEDYEADAKLVDSLKSNLGNDYLVRYPFLPEEKTPDFGRRKQINDEIASSNDNVILVGHSLGASMLLVLLSETRVTLKIGGVFLLATPFWNGTEDWVQAFKLKPGFSERLDKKTPLFFYQCHDDAEVPFAHFDIYKKQIPWARFREIEKGGHQFGNNLGRVARDIKSLGIQAADIHMRDE